MPEDWVDDIEQTDLSPLTTSLISALQARRLEGRIVHAVAISPNHDRHHLSRVQRARHLPQRCCGPGDTE
jgi:hypothetical protein